MPIFTSSGEGSQVRLTAAPPSPHVVWCRVPGRTAAAGAANGSGYGSDRWCAAVAAGSTQRCIIGHMMPGGVRQPVRRHQQVGTSEWIWENSCTDELNEAFDKCAFPSHVDMCFDISMPGAFTRRAFVPIKSRQSHQTKK